MVATVIILITSAYIAFFEWPIIKKHKKDKIVFFAILTISTIFAIIEINNIQIPNPLIGIYSIYEPIGSFFIEKILS